MINIEGKFYANTVEEMELILEFMKKVDKIRNEKYGQALTGSAGNNSPNRGVTHA